MPYGRFHLEVALRHNLRELVAERGTYGNIDSHKTKKNIILRGQSSAAAAMLDADEIVRSADTGGKQLRKDAVWGIELVFTSLPSENEDIIKYFDDCTSWAEAEFNVPILSSVIHLDQGHPHCHVLLIPLFKGVLTAKKVYGNKSVMVARLDSFYEVVGRKYGLRRRRSRVKLASAQRKGLLQRCADFLSEGRWLTGKQIETILKPFREDPLPLAESLGVVFGGARSQVKFASMFGQGTPFVA